MFATALHRELWLLLEYRGPWRARATTDNDLPEVVQEWLDAQLEAAAGTGRVQFIKRSGAENGITFFIGHTQEVKPCLYQFRLESYLDLLDLEVAEIVAEEARYETARREEPLFLVCTNGRRDRCCALYGIAAYDALAPVAGNAVWQTTHLGGHRFAANLATFPDGTYYGRIRPADATAFVRARQRGELYLEQLRGRTCYDKVEQAADYFLRQQTGELALDAFRHIATSNPIEEVYEVTFAATAGGRVHRVRLRREPSDLPIYASCGQLPTKPVWQYNLIHHEVEAA